MKLEMHDGLAVVRLSRRNLRALLSKLDMPGSARTIVKQDDENGPVLLVIAEDDATHYLQRDYPPGPMHPQTEADIA